MSDRADIGNGQMKLPDAAFCKPIADYMDCVAAKSEVPDEFHWASYVAAVGLQFGRRVFNDYGHALHLNFYFTLIGPTGVKKSTAIRHATNLGDDLSDSAEVQTLQGVSTPEGLIEILSARDDTSILIVEDELRVLLKKALQKSNGGLLPHMCKLFDAPERLDLPTRKDPLVATRPTVALLCAATPESLEDCLGDHEVYGGLLNRILFVAGGRKAPEPWPTKPDGRMWAALLRDLESRLGRYSSVTELSIVDPDAMQLWEHFYEDLHTRLGNCSELLVALQRRLDVHVRKLALFYAALRGGDSIEYEDLERAIHIIDFIAAVIETSVQPLGLNPAKLLESRFEAALMQSPLTRRQLHQKIGGRTKAPEFNSMLHSLIALDRILELDGGLLAWAGAPYCDRLGVQDEVTAEAPQC